MRGTRRWHLVTALLAIAVVAAACGGDDGNGEDGNGGPTAGATGETAGATGDGGGASDITIEGFAFSPSTVEVSGETTLTVTNEDGAAHTFTLDDGSVDERLDPGASAEVTVNVSETTGFSCTIHPQMTGTLEVA